MITKFAQGNKVNYDIQKWLVEEESELSTIPRCIIGSTAYVISTAESWMMDSKGKWHVMNSSEKPPVECDCVEELTIWGNLPEPQTI